MQAELLKKYIEHSQMVGEWEKFEINWDPIANTINFFDDEWDLLIEMTVDELIESDIFIECLSKATWKSIMEFRFMHKNISEIEEYIKNI